MNVNSIQILNFEQNLYSADIIIKTEAEGTFSARIENINKLVQQVVNSADFKSKFIDLPFSEIILADNLDESFYFEVFSELLEKSEFRNNFKKVN